MSRIVFERVGSTKCMDTTPIYLIYENKEDRKFAPQFRLLPDQLERRVDIAFVDGMDITIYEEEPDEN